MLVTVLGEAGIGKTRLARELAAHLAGEATVLAGNCLSYGEGITFAPLRKLVGQTGPGECTREELEALLAGQADAGRVAERLSAALSPRGQGVFSAAERRAGSWRRLHRWEPLLVILDDLHWAEPTFLDLVEALPAQAEDVPCCCSAWPARSCWSSVRPGRPAHGGPSPSSWSPLAADDAAILLDAPAEVPPPAWGRKQLLEAAARQALALYERKEDRVSVARARPLLAAGTPTTRPLPVNGGA